MLVAASLELWFSKQRGGRAVRCANPRRGTAIEMSFRTIWCDRKRTTRCALYALRNSCARLALPLPQAEGSPPCPSISIDPQKQRPHA